MDATLAAYFLLFAFTFKVGKSYENSVNHGGNTSYQSNDKISCHSQASFNLVFQRKLVEFRRLTAWNIGISNDETLPDNLILEKRYLTHITTALRVFWAPSRLARLSLGQPCTGNVDNYQN